MKKILVVTLAVIMMMSIGTIGAFAMGYGGGRNYVDADGDGICDNAQYRETNHGCGFRGGRNK